MKLRLLCAGALLLITALPSAAQTDASFETRRSRLLDVAAAETEVNMMTILAKLHTGRDLPGHSPCSIP